MALLRRCLESLKNNLHLCETPKITRENNFLDSPFTAQYYYKTLMMPSSLQCCD
jgi:hypothetical protein